jgi:DNA-binding MarR family transcriptional regulator
MLWLLHDTARLWCKRFDREVCARIPGMTRAQCIVLVHLARHEGVNQAALAQILQIEPITLARVLDRLEAAGFITRKPDLRDGRAYVLALTAKAPPVIERIHELAGKIHGVVQRGIAEAEANQLRDLLCRVRSNLLVSASGVSSAEPRQRRVRV